MVSTHLDSSLPASASCVQLEARTEDDSTVCNRKEEINLRCNICDPFLQTGAYTAGANAVKHKLHTLIELLRTKVFLYSLCALLSPSFVSLVGLYLLAH